MKEPRAMILQRNACRVFIAILLSGVVFFGGTFLFPVPYANPVYTVTFARQTAMTMTGIWDITLSVQRPGQTPLAGTFQIQLAS